jgi:hypothetical protein
VTAIDGNILEGVSATTLWTLHNRGTEAKPSDGVIRDPWSVTLFDAISYDYRKFGKPNQTHGLRAVAFDAAAREFLTVHPKASVVALAEGLQTGFWRLDRAGVAAELRWYSVDLPQVMALRERLRVTWPPLDRIGLFRASGPASRCWNSVSAHLAEHVTQWRRLDPECGLGLRSVQYQRPVKQIDHLGHLSEYRVGLASLAQLFGG